MKERISTEPQENIMNDPVLNAQAQLLRVRVQAALGKPAVVMVTSACSGDGKSLTAYTLASSLANCDHRVSVVEIPNEEGGTISRDRLAEFVEKLRSEYDFAIIDAETLVNSSTAMTLTRLVDGILLAVRVGRAPTADDEAMVRMIEQFGSRVVGVVAAERETIADFERARRGKPFSTRLSHRRSSEQSPAPALMTEAAEQMLG
jgi:Mrp family chromosome partitioning ATPase